MRSCQTYWRKPPQGKICHNSLICWKTIRNYVKCTRRDSGVCHKGVERIPVRSHCEGSRFQQLTRRELSAGKKRLILIIWNLPAPRFQPPFFFFCWVVGNVHGVAVQMSIVRMKDVRALGPIGLDYGITGLIIGQSSGKKSQPRYRCSWMTGRQKGWTGLTALISCFYSTLWAWAGSLCYTGRTHMQQCAAQEKK